MSEKNSIQYIIRDFTDSDYHALAALWEVTGLGNAKRGDDLSVIRRTLACGGKMLVMEHEETGQIIGTSWLTNDGRRIYLHHFGIHPSFQGKGLAHPLADASIRYARDCGLQIKLEVHKDNLTAKTLYLKHGFQYLGDYHVYIIRSFG